MCGGRSYGAPPQDATAEDIALAESQKQHLQEVLDRYEITEMCHGAATGADTVAGEYAKERGIPCIEYPADWGTFGPSAGPRRNQIMLERFRPDLVVAFPGGKGTADLTKRAAARGVRIVTS